MLSKCFVTFTIDQTDKNRCSWLLILSHSIAVNHLIFWNNLSRSVCIVSISQQSFRGLIAAEHPAFLNWCTKHENKRSKTERGRGKNFDKGRFLAEHAVAILMKVKKILCFVFRYVLTYAILALKGIELSISVSLRTRFGSCLTPGSDFY